MKAATRRRYDALTRIGCCVCRREFGIYTPPAIHHLRGHPWSGAGQRANDEHTIGLCSRHHQDGGYGVAYHAGPAEFERRYGTQAELLAWCNARLKMV